MKSNLRKTSRSMHLWIAVTILLPVAIVIASGLLLQVKKEFSWVQPPTQKGTNSIPTLSFEEILTAAKSVPEAEIASWDDVDRLDVRPGKGVIKIQSNNHWEIQIDATSAEVLSSEYRRSNTIEAIHDGSWFFEGAKLWIFLPVGILLFVMWITGGVLTYSTLKSKYKKTSYQRRSSQR